MAIIKDWNLGGIGDSKRQGLRNSAYKMSNCSVHEEPGYLKCFPDLAEDGNSSIIDEEVIAIVPADDTKTYFFGSSGGVWSRTTSAVYAKVGDITSGSAYGKIFDAKFFDGYLYYTMQQRVGQWDPDVAWSSRDDDFKTIEFDTFHPMIVIENDLYVGHTNDVGKIAPSESSGGTITDVLTLDSKFTVESFGEVSKQLAIGTRVFDTSSENFTGFSKVFRWDLVSNTWSNEKDVQEFGVSCFFDLNGALLFNSGKQGNLYSYDGNNVQLFKRIPGMIGNEGIIKKNASTKYNGITMFGLTDETGSPVSGVYSLGGYDPKYPKVFNLPIEISNADIKVLTRIGEDLFISYDTGSSGLIRKLGTDLAAAVLETQVFDVKEVRTPKIAFTTVPSGASIGLQVSKNGASYAVLTLDEREENMYQAIRQLNARTLQYKITLTPNGANGPVVEYLET